MVKLRQKRVSEAWALGNKMNVGLVTVFDTKLNSNCGESLLYSGRPSYHSEDNEAHAVICDPPAIRGQTD